MLKDLTAIWGSFLLVMSVAVIMVTKATGIWWLELGIFIVGCYIATVVLRLWRHFSVQEEIERRLGK